MMRRCLVLVLGAAVAGCSGPKARPDAAGPAAVGLAPVALPLAFYLEEGRSAADDARIVEVIEHGCGKIALVAVPPMPVESKAFEIEEFAEIDARGAVLRRWRGPTDVFVAGASGGLLGLQNGADGAFWLDAAGNLYQRRATAVDAIEWIDCPAGAPFAGSDFQACVVVPDAGTNARRTFAYQRPCT